MLNTMLIRIRAQDADVWRIATRSAPVVVQFVWAALFGIGWLLGRLPLDNHAGFRILVATASVLTTVGALVVGGVLLRAETPRRRGLGLAIGGSGIAASASGLVYALIFLPIMDPHA
ncbi:hypothetical protein [Mycolicibacter sinensis]|uniref:Transmembrane protein n=1 Tax=Mycolicibacter sinensis (strain JDM601) TaxID=875328 RepID=A0A1A3TQ74_MYCSD|nr:hypothetical protein [Mycolicibacter sinensis]OBK84805.1 hypothetical protein A5648_08355 [Mycolicibacter sinensis]